MTVERRRMSRTRILQGAVQILDDGVYGDLTVDALARSLHMSKSTLYKYFASKDDVVIAVIEGACQEAEAALADTDLEGPSPEAALHTVMDVVAAHADRIPRAAVLQQARLPGSCQDRLQLTRATLSQAVHRVMARGAQSGAFQFSEVALAATALMASVDAAMQASARGEIPTDRGAAVRTILTLFTPGLRQSQVSAA